MKRNPATLLYVALILFAPSLFAQTLNLPAERYSLKNGLRVVLSRDTSSPQVAVVLIYDVGSRNEVKGRTGFAHLFEHMMFQGSANAKKGVHFKLIKKPGGSLNATTSNDRTLYYSVVPSNHLATVLWLESDRMRSLKVNQKNLDNQRSSVKEERRQRIDNRAYMPSFLRLSKLFYKNWAYSHSVIGSMKDLNSAVLKDFQQFFKTWYGPNNCVLTLAGDFDPKQAKKLIQYYFGDIPRGPKPPKVTIVEPPQTKKKELQMYDKNAKLPAFHMAWHTPPNRSKDYYPLSILGQVLLGGKSSRLYRLLVKQKQLVLGIYGGPAGKRGPDMFKIFAVTRRVHGKKVRPFIFEALKKIAREGVPERELQKVKNNYVSSFIFGTQRNVSRAKILARFETFFGDARLANTELARYLSVSAKDLQRVAKKYFSDNNLTVIDVTPGPAPKPIKPGKGGRR